MATAGSSSKSRRAGKGKDPPDVKLSKFLSYICRHGAEKEGLVMLEDGFVEVAAILALPSGCGFTEADVQRVVANCPKQRFSLRQESGEMFIRANQGHSLEVKELELVPIAIGAHYPVVVHGTYKRAKDAIKREGLSRMKRNHIHFATGLPGDEGVISGMRRSCQVLIFIDMEKAMQDGLTFYRSANDVILCPGNEEGYLLPKYFQKIVEL